MQTYIPQSSQQPMKSVLSQFSRWGKQNLIVTIDKPLFVMVPRIKGLINEL